MLAALGIDTAPSQLVHMTHAANKIMLCIYMSQHMDSYHPAFVTSALVWPMHHVQCTTWCMWRWETKALT